MGINIEQYSNISKEEFEIEIVTPLFLGGADKSKSEIRPASIKGAIRFWWRALYGYKFDSIEDMAEQEGNIFGSTEIKSSFSIMVNEDLESIKENLKKGETFSVHGHPIGILHYLSYGLYDYVRREGNVFNKEHIKDKQRFNIILSFYNKSYKEEVLNSFYALIKFGSIGAKARNGFGSLNIKNIPNPSINVGNNLLGFTAFSKEIKLFMGNEKDKWEDALSEIGMVYKDAKLKLEDKHQWKNRSLVALPIDVKAIHPKQTKETLQGRHTKPYFLHINKLENGKYQGQILFLPYKHKDLHNYMNVHAEMCNYMKNNALQEVQL